ncbi:hypothetical protein QLQ12_09530 [Actinoplanes sp. NEAU-A12]|uniref:Lipoprotein n=1 Tax=Actinoplanes sandaracinus TaxID=3045177 RepID=A0ABT6WGJ4_9ACTN|nr:hypothetical protein [Actinoplanes sandaracinus]MDI6098839.1 hypothetical protein [Actinoplanes sandaracinus]
MTVTVAALGMTGCAAPGTTVPPAAASPSGPSPDAHQALRDSVSALRTGDYSFTRTGADSVADIRRGSLRLPGSVLLEYAETAATMRVDGATYLRYALHGTGELREQYLQYYKKSVKPEQLRELEQIYTLLDGARWVRADEKRLTEAAAVDEQSGLDYMAAMPTTEKPDATGAGSLIAAVTSAERSGEAITGTLDATRKDPELELLFSDPAYLYGPGAKAMPFRATLDDQGRLTEFTVTMPSQQMASQPPDPVDPEPPLVITISGYGATEPLSAPKDAATLPTLAYDLLARDTD